MNDEELAAIAARANAATQGPWRWQFPGSNAPTLAGVAGDENYSYEVDVVDASHEGQCACRSLCELTLTVSDADAEFIAHAREDIPALIAEVRRLRREAPSPTEDGLL